MNFITEMQRINSMLEAMHERILDDTDGLEKYKKNPKSSANMIAMLSIKLDKSIDIYNGLCISCTNIIEHHKKASSSAYAKGRADMKKYLSGDDTRSILSYRQIHDKENLRNETINNAIMNFNL